MNVQIWAYGQTQELTIAEDPQLENTRQNYSGQYQKFQIILHFTAGHGQASSIVRGWNGRQASAHFVLEREEHNPGLSMARIVQTADDLERVTHHSGFASATGGSRPWTRNAIGIEVSNWGNGRGMPTSISADVHRHLALQLSYPDSSWDFESNGQLLGGRSYQSNCAQGIYEAYQEGQYRTLILLLRYLCERFDIHRVFLGHNARTNLRCYRSYRDLMGYGGLRRGLKDFNGLYSHCNIAETKACGGPALNRNRLYRGIAEEWWVPVDIDGRHRSYYTGPYSENRDLSRWVGGHLEHTPLANAHIEGLQETRSYYHPGSFEAYCGHIEATGRGTFPVGENGCYHGGIHFVPPAGHAQVYAAASGTIVAARVDRIDAVERRMGSPRFVLIRHAVFLDWDAAGTSVRIDYRSNPIIVFSLYMHLAPPGQPGEISWENPEWYNTYLRGGGTDGGVFAPNVEVMVGDYLGSCDRWYDDPHCLHFEIVSNTNIRPGDASAECPESETCRPPWWAHDLESDSEYLPSTEDMTSSVPGQGLNDVRAMRSYAIRHPSEWALDQEQFSRALISEPSVSSLWPLVDAIGWYEDARRVSPRLVATELPAEGNLVHYHPILFMHTINCLLEIRGDYAGEAQTYTGSPSRGTAAHEERYSRQLSGRPGENTLCLPYRFSV